MEKFIAERKLQYSEKGSDIRKNFSIRISAPYPVDERKVEFPIKEGFSGCSIYIDGLGETLPDVYGADSLQAVNLASNVEPFLERLQKKYEIYWSSGEPYFDDA